MPTSTRESRRIVENFWSAMQSNDWRLAADFLHDDYILEWPQSSERVRGRENFFGINANYPAHGRWTFKILALLAENNRVVSHVEVTDGTITAGAITFSTIRDGKIWRQTEYWPDSFEPAAWRSQWVERIF